jgi:hypothetical protein
MVPSLMPDPIVFIKSMADTSASHALLFSMRRSRLTSAEYECLIPRALTWIQSWSNCFPTLSVFSLWVRLAWRARADVLPEGSPMCTVPPPSYSSLNASIARAGVRVAHQGHGAEAEEVHPVQRH